MYPSAGGLHSSVDSERAEDVSVLRGEYLGFKWTCLTRWPLYGLSREWAYNQFLQVACLPWHFSCYPRGVNLLAFTLLPNRVVGRRLPIVSLEEVLLLDERAGQILPGVLAVLESYLATVFDGGAKVYSFPEQSKTGVCVVDE